MKDEIKEILDRLEIVARKHTIRVCDDGSKIETMPASVVDELRLNNFSAKLLLDYITNLQEENERLKGENEKFNDLINKLDVVIEQADYKSRCEKAVDEIQQLIDDVSNKTIIGLNNFLPKLEEIQDKLANGGDEE